MIVATAPGKVILFGEHAVVYGRPAIAVPITQVRATAVITPSDTAGVQLIAPDLGAHTTLVEASHDNPLAAAVQQVQAAIGLDMLPSCRITVTSQIPIASGLGSGAAVTAAVIRAFTLFLGHGDLLTNEWVSALTYEVEKIYHGTPSGIDNTVVTYEQPVYFVRRQPHNHIEAFRVARPLRLLVADSGIRSSTRVVVGDVRQRWQADPASFEALFDRCAQITVAARLAIEQGQLAEVGRLMNENHDVLQQMTVSSPELDRLVRAAREAGAAGAKMSGAGRGGNMIALVSPAVEEAVRAALLAAGAQAVLTSIV